MNAWALPLGGFIEDPAMVVIVGTRAAMFAPDGTSSFTVSPAIAPTMSVDRPGLSAALSTKDVMSFAEAGAT